MKNKNIVFWIFAGGIWLTIFVLIAIKIWSGAFEFWYDPARDMLSAWNNLSKPTLIGPPSGIPGIFYGPYWIWMLSIAQVISHNVSFVVFVVETIPYLVILPVILFLFKGVFDRRVAFLLWTLFILEFGKYAYSLWNPYPAPLLFAVVILLFISTEMQKNSLKNRIFAISSGVITGLLVNIHLSFGIGLVFGIVVYEIVTLILHFRKYNKTKTIFIWFSNLFSVAIGFAVSLVPFFLFEVRHGFTQTKTFANTFSHFGNVVTTTGLTKAQIFHSFFESFSMLLSLPFNISVLMLVAGIVYMVYAWKQKKISFETEETRLIIFLICISATILMLYLTAKNPIWSYHFIGVEIIFLLGIGIIIHKTKIFQFILGIWIIMQFLFFVQGMVVSLRINPSNVAGNVASEEKIVRLINGNANRRDYTVFVYSPSIYSYEFSYMFKYMYSKNVPYRPELNPQNSKLVYLVFPPEVEKAIYVDFVHFRTPDASYITAKQWNLPSGSIILKRVKK